MRELVVPHPHWWSRKTLALAGALIKTLAGPSRGDLIQGFAPEPGFRSSFSVLSVGRLLAGAGGFLSTAPGTAMGGGGGGSRTPAAIRKRRSRERLYQDPAAHAKAKAKDAQRNRLARAAIKAAKAAIQDRREQARREARFAWESEVLVRRQKRVEEEVRAWRQMDAKRAAAAAAVAEREEQERRAWQTQVERQRQQWASARQGGPGSSRHKITAWCKGQRAARGKAGGHDASCLDCSPPGLGHQPGLTSEGAGAPAAASGAGHGGHTGADQAPGSRWGSPGPGCLQTPFGVARHLVRQRALQ